MESLAYPTEGLSRNVRAYHATADESIVNALVVEALADESALLRERIASLESDCEVYRLIAHTALDALTDVTARAARLAAERDRLRAECCFLREERLLRLSADDEVTP